MHIKLSIDCLGYVLNVRFLCHKPWYEFVKLIICEGKIIIWKCKLEVPLAGIHTQAFVHNFEQIDFTARLHS